MTITAEIREQVRQRANFACEFCGVTESDTGDQLTVDHFQPKSKGGADDIDNLIYCCVNCNQYKLDYWPTKPADPMLWNPRHESASQHFILFDNGTLHHLTLTGQFTIKRLRLNRPSLVTYRVKRYQQAEEKKLMTQYKNLIQNLASLNKQLADLLEEQQHLLDEQRRLLRMMLDKSR